MDQFAPSPQVLEARLLEGFLEKVKPESLIPISQKRYFKFIEDGRVLAYAEKKEDFDKGGPAIKGQILIQDILECVTDPGNPKKFEIVVSDRVYKLSNKDPNIVLKWVTAIQILNTYEIDRERNWENYMKELDPDFLIEEAVESLEGGKGDFNILQPIHFLTNTAKKVVVDGAVGTAVGIMKKSVKGVGDLFVDQKPKVNEEYLRAKKMNDALDAIPPQLLKSRVKMGIIIREVKEATGLGLVDNLMNDTGLRDSFVRRWCFLISSKPILHSEADPEDETTLTAGKLPPNLSYDTLYMYDESCDSSNFLDAVNMKDVLSVVVKKKVHTEGQFRFVLDLGEKKFNLLCTSFADMDLWLRAIQASRAVAREYERSHLPTLKNMYWVFKMFDGKDGEAKLLKKIQAEYEKIAKDDSLLGATNVKPLIGVVEQIAIENVALINACLAHRQPRTDVIQKYMDVYHEGIMNYLRNYFNRHTNDLENGDIFDMIKFLAEYQKNLLIFGTTFADSRIKDGIQMLSKIASRKIIKGNLKMVGGILMRQAEDDPQLDARGRLITVTPKEVMKILNDALNMLNYCSIEGFLISMTETCQNILQYYQNGLEELIEKADLSNEQLISICNDAITFANEIKDFVNVIINVTNLKADVVALYFKDKTLIKTFEAIGKKCTEKLSENIVPKADDKMKPFLQVDLKEIVTNTLQVTEDLSEKIHPSYASKLRSSLLKQTVTFYVQCFLNSAEKKTIKKENLKEICTKLRSAIQIIADAYKAFRDIKGSELEKTLEPIEEFEDFMTRNYELLPLAVQNMKQSYGNFLKWSTIEHLLRFRENEIPKESRDETMNSCKEIFKVTESANGDQDKFNVFTKVSQGQKLSIDVSGAGDSTGPDSSEKVKTPKRSFRTSGTSTTLRLNLDGYLGVDTNILQNVIGSILSGGRNENKYFSIRKNFLYCYKDNSAESAEMSLNLHNAVDCVPDEKVKFIIKIKEDGGTKDYKFTAESDHRRDLWVKTIKNVMNNKSLSRGNSVMLDEDDSDLYKDETPLFTEIEKMPSLKYEYTKEMKAKCDALRASRKAEAARAKTENPKGKGGSQSTASTASSDSKRKKSLTFTGEDLVPDNADQDLEIAPKPGFCGCFCMKLGVKSKGTMKN